MPCRRLRLEMLPARQGDCLLVEWSAPDRVLRMLVDAGPAPAYPLIAQRLALLAPPRIDVLVLTHVDADHVEGAILLTNDRDLDIEIGEVWYNGSRQLAGELGPVQGEILSAIIEKRALGWNGTFGAAAVKAPDQGRLVDHELPGGMRVTVLSPDGPCLRRLRDVWWEVCQEEGLAVGSVEDALRAPGCTTCTETGQSYLAAPEAMDVDSLARSRSATDRSLPNASSVVLLLEYGGERLLLAGDSTPDMLLPAVRRLLHERAVDRLPLSAFKLPHHGSAKNVTRPLLECLPAWHYLFSSDGSYFRHPDPAAVARVVQYGAEGAELVFNYDTARTRAWDDDRLRDPFGYRVRYPDEGSTTVAVEWSVPSA